MKAVAGVGRETRFPFAARGRAECQALKSAWQCEVSECLVAMRKSGEVARICGEIVVEEPDLKSEFGIV